MPQAPLLLPLLLQGKLRDPWQLAHSAESSLRSATQELPASRKMSARDDKWRGAGVIAQGPLKSRHL